MALHIGQNLGPYEIISSIGKGGMGEVFRARDKKLHRDVAVKVLPDAFGDDAERLLRFQREAQLLASLSHPNVAHVYGLEESGGTQCLVMELVQGETLEQRLKRGPLGASEALQMALQIAEALEAAHEHTIVHRDLKPGNIMVAADGKVKVLDFGLAKTSGSEEVPANLSQSPTRSALTGGDVILGTAAYMSPEQAKGKNVDRRTDIFSFGCVLYEMITGRRAFDGENVADILSRVLQRDPDWTLMPARTPPAIQRLMRLCLEKDLKRRRQTATDVRIDIEQAMAEPLTTGSAPAPSRGSHGVFIASWALSVGLAIGLTVLLTGRFGESPPAEVRPQILTPSTPSPVEFALSPNGRLLTFVASGNGPQRLWLRSLDQTDAQPLTGTDGAGYPFWSGDNRSVGFFAAGRLYRVDIGGGPPREVAGAPTPRGGTWNADGTIVFAPGQGALMQVAASGGQPAAVTRLAPGQTSHRFPQFLPDGRHFLFYAQGSAETSGIYLASLDGGEPRRLAPSSIAAAWLHPDRILFVREGALVAQTVDLSQGTATGEPVVVADPVAANVGINLGAFSVSADGTIAYLATMPPMQLWWFDKAGRSLGAASEPNMTNAASADLSPDGRRVVLQRTLKNNTDVYIWDLVRSSFRRLTIDPVVDQLPVWSADGDSIAFLSTTKGAGNLYIKASDGDGTTPATLVFETPNNKAPQHWSKNGSLLYLEIDPKTSNDLWALDMRTKNPKPRGVANTAFDERMGQFSPDGRWVAYASNESDRFEIVVQGFPDPGRKVQVSINGGTTPRWKADGRELYFVAPDGKMMGATVNGTGSLFEADPPAALFPTQLAGSGITSFSPQYAVSSDGRFLINQPAPDSASPITLILNWNAAKK